MSRSPATSLAGLFLRRGAGEPLQPQTPDEQRYAALLQQLGDGSDDVPDVLTQLRGVELRPYFLLNGLLHAAQWQEEGARRTCYVLGRGLQAFAALFDDGRQELQGSYFAFLIAWWPSCGIGLEAVLATMKADALDLATAYAARELLEGGPPAFGHSELFDDAEKQLWAALFADEAGAAERLQLHFARVCGVDLSEG
jgi:hypothetical protein